MLDRWEMSAMLMKERDKEGEGDTYEGAALEQFNSVC